MSIRSGVQRVALERRRQQTEEGYTLEHDRENMRPAWLMDHARRFIVDWFRDTNNVRALEKAGALIAAAIDQEDPGQVLEEGIDPRRFLLVRHTDVSGVSGTGVVAEGIEFSDGLVVLHWRGDHPSVVTWVNGMESVEAIHGHGGATTVGWLD